MPRKKVTLSANYPIHISARCINREWFELPLTTVWSIMEDYLKFISFGYNIEIVSFVLMSNHFHLLVYAPELNLSLAMNYFMRETSRQISYLTSRINQTYGSRFHRTLIQTTTHLYHTYKYIYRNPVKAGIVTCAEDYMFSTLRGLVGKSKLCIPLKEDTILFSSPENTLSWINRPPSKENEELVRKALRRKVFEIPKDRKSGKMHLLDEGVF